MSLKAEPTEIEFSISENQYLFGISRYFLNLRQVWKRIQLVAMKRLESSVFESIPHRQVTDMISKKEALGVSVLRMVPKLKGVRFIVNMGKRTKDSLSINKQLTNLFHVLVFEKVDNVYIDYFKLISFRAESPAWQIRVVDSRSRRIAAAHLTICSQN